MSLYLVRSLTRRRGSTRHRLGGWFAVERGVFRKAAAAAALLCIATAGSLRGQSEKVRWTIDAKASLAWWQIDPHYSHLWATTCPDDPSWQPGEGWSPGSIIDYLRRHRTADAGHSDPRIPLYPRRRVRSLCREAVRGQVSVGDTVSWTGVEGQVTVLADSLFTGLKMRDSYAGKKVLEAHKYPEIRFNLDRLADVQPGDTLRATAVGTFELHGVAQPVQAPLSAWYESGALRVRARWQMDAQDLVKVYGMSKWALGMGVTMRRWKTAHMGVDLVLRPGEE